MDKVIIEVLNKLEEKGYKAYLVGGYPRDLYMGNISTDYDICTSAKPKEIKSIFNNYIVSSEKYGCVTIFIHNKRFEITTFRKDISYFNNRFPISLKYVKDLKTDLNRRDFKMNTICIDAKGNYIDLLNGKKDIDEKIISTVGESDKKIREDALRILRAVRFATILDFNLASDLKSSIKKYKKLIKNLSYERKKEELDKIFASSNAIKGIQLIKELDLEKYLDISLTDMKPVNNIMGYWAQAEATKYHFNKTEQEQLKKIKELLKKELNNQTIYKYGLYVSLIVGEIKGLNTKEITNKYNSLRIKSKQDIKIEPLEICSILNKEPGPFLNDIIKDLEVKIIEGRIENDKDALSEYIKLNY